MESVEFNEDIIYRKIGEQRILVPVGASIDAVRSIFSLNETAALIVDELKQSLSIESAAYRLFNDYEFPNLDAARKEVHELIHELRKNNIIL